MKKITSLLLLALALPFLAACSEDRDSNPVLQTPTTFVLNLPAYATNNTYVLENSDSVILTTSQPDYGMPLATTYTVEVSLDSTTFQTLSTTYTSTRLALSPTELNEAMQTLAGDAFSATAQPLYVRLNAYLTANDTLGNITSNIIKLPSVLPYSESTTVSLPTTMYIIGDFPAASSWSTFVALHPAYGKDGFFYGLLYLQAGAAFKINPDNAWKGNDKGYGQVTLNDEAGASITSANGETGGNFQVANGGWYTIAVQTSVSSGAVKYTLNVLQPRVYLFGATNGGVWEYSDTNLFSVPSDETGSFVSPALSAAGEVRIAIRTTDNVSWWQTECTLYNGTTIFYRNSDISSSWESNAGAAYSIQGTAGNVVKLNFTTDTGSVE